MKNINKNKQQPSTTWRNAIMSSDLEDKTKVVACVIASHAYENKDWANPAYKLIKEESNIKTDKTIRRHTKLLCDLGWMNVTKRKSPAGQYNRYQLTLPEGVEPEVTSLTRGVTSPPSLPSIPEPSLPETQPSLPEGQASLLEDQASLPQREVEVLTIEVQTVSTKEEVYIEDQGIDTPFQGKKDQGISPPDGGTRKMKNHIQEIVDRGKGKLPDNYFPLQVREFPKCLDEAENRYNFLISLGFRKDKQYPDCEKWFSTWVQDDDDPISTLAIWAVSGRSIKQLVSDPVWVSLANREKWIRGQNFMADTHGTPASGMDLLKRVHRFYNGAGQRPLLGNLYSWAGVSV